MNKNPSAVVVFVIALILLGCATISNAEEAPTVVIIGGAGSTVEQLEPLHKALAGSVVVMPDKYYPLSGAAEVVRQQILDKGVTGKVILVGWSWGALIAHQINGMYEGWVVAIIGIASPLDIAFVPNGIGAPFNPDDRDSQTPLYVIAGVKPGAEKKWYMTSDESDGTVDINAAFKAGNRNMIASAKIVGEDADHWNVIRHPGTVKQVTEWMEKINVNRRIVLTALSVR